MDNQRHTHSLKLPIGEFWALRSGGRWQIKAGDMRKIYADLLKNLSIGQYPSPSAATFAACPEIFYKPRFRFFPFQILADLILQDEQIVFYFVGAVTLHC